MGQTQNLVEHHDSFRLLFKLKNYSTLQLLKLVKSVVFCDRKQQPSRPSLSLRGGLRGGTWMKLLTPLITCMKVKPVCERSGSGLCFMFLKKLDPLRQSL